MKNGSSFGLGLPTYSNNKKVEKNEKSTHVAASKGDLEPFYNLKLKQFFSLLNRVRAPVVDEPLRGVRMEPREVEVGGVPRVLLEDAVGGAEVGLLVAVQGAPARPEDDDGAVRDAAVPGLPSGQVVHRQPGVGVGRCPGAVYRFRPWST